MNVDSRHRFLHRDTTYERATSQVRWISIGLAALTFPIDLPQTLIVWCLSLLGCLYGLSRYHAGFMRHPVLSSRILMLLIDNLFVGALLLMVGSIATPYSAFLVLMIISATYWYGLRGAFTTISGQALFLVVMTMLPYRYTPVALDPWRLIFISVAILSIVGFFVERLTRAERHERKTLETLSNDSQSERDRLLTLVNSLHEAIVVTDARGKILISNGAAAELTPLQGDLRGRDIGRALPLRRRSRTNINLYDIAHGNSDPQHRRDLSIAGPDGSIIELDISITPVQLGHKQNTNYIIVCHDITKEKSLDAQREEFISVASHELRTPLAISEAALSTALLLQDKMPPEAITLIEQAHRNTVFLAGLVKDLTTLSQAQNDNIPIELKPVDPKVLLTQLVKDFMAQADEKRLGLKSIVLPNTPSILSTEHHIREILQNYIANALKYTQEGGIIVKAEASSNGGVLFAVQDTGIGISASDQRNLFTKFYRSEDYRTRETGGTGLGLYLCLELAERLNARVWAKSTLNHGSIFYLEVPPYSQLQRDHGKVVEAEVSTLIDQL